MYSYISDFIKDWQTETELTLKIFNCISDESLSFKAYENGRTIGRIAWHITTSVSEMGKMSGIEMDALNDKMEGPFSASYICSEYKLAAEQIMKGVSSWENEKLKEEINMYGEKWTRGFSLLVLVRHQIHHRAQLTILMREAGLKVPGIYGPSREEWSQFNMQPME